MDNQPYQGHLSIYFWKCTKKFRAHSIHESTHRSHYMNFKQSKRTRIRSYLRWNPSLEGNSSKKLLPISTIEITPQYAIVLSTYSWNRLVFLWGKKDYLASDTALMWRGEREREIILMEVDSWVWISMMCTMPLNPFLIWATFEL